MNGRIIGIKVDGEFVPCETGCDFSVDGERIATSSKENGSWRNSIAGYRSWKVGVNGNLVINGSPAGAMLLTRAIILGTNVQLIMTMRITNAEIMTITGTVGTTNITINAPSVGLATWSGSFEGVGAFTLDYSY